MIFKSFEVVLIEKGYSSNFLLTLIHHLWCSQLILETIVLTYMEWGMLLIQEKEMLNLSVLVMVALQLKKSNWAGRGKFISEDILVFHWNQGSFSKKHQGLGPGWMIMGLLLPQSYCCYSTVQRIWLRLFCLEIHIPENRTVIT